MLYTNILQNIYKSFWFIIKLVKDREYGFNFILLKVLDIKSGKLIELLSLLIK